MAVGSDPSASGDDCWYRGDGRCGDPCLTAWLIDDEIGPEERQGREAPGATTSGPPAPSRLAGLLRLPHDGIALNEHYEGDGATIYKHACALGCEGIVSKRLGSP